MKFILFSAFLLTTAFTYWLRQINLRHLKIHGATVPAGFENAVSQATLAKTAAYTFATSRLGLWESFFNNVLLILFLFAGILPLYDGWVTALSHSFIMQAVLFFLLLSWTQTVLDLPFSLYGTFVVEHRYGFNTMTPRLWVTDQLKSQAIGSLLLVLIISAIFRVIQWSPDRWWLYVWGCMALFSLFMMFISPYLIEPLYNKFEPVTEEGLQDEISAMMAKAGLTVGKVVQMDASLRSRHSNAYFTGIGKVKRIVLFDTLIQQMSHAEIIAILAHEIGHWKLKHILKRLVMVELFMLGGAWCAFHLLQGELLPQLIGLASLSLPAKLVILGFIASLAMFPLTPLFSWLSRRDEYAADHFACGITADPESLASALIKLSSENLSNLHPHPHFAKFYYSHPPVVERVRELKQP